MNLKSNMKETSIIQWKFPVIKNNYEVKISQNIFSQKLNVN